MASRSYSERLARGSSLERWEFIENRPRSATARAAGEAAEKKAAAEADTAPPGDVKSLFAGALMPGNQGFESGIVHWRTRPQTT